MTTQASPTATMTALRWHGRHDIRIDAVPIPGPPGAGEVQLRVLWCGICGTDIEEWRHGPVFIPVGESHPLTGSRAPLTLGHELTGEVHLVGPGVTHLALGQRVAVDGLSSCGTCHWCLRNRPVLCPKLSAVGLMADGGLAEFCNVPAHGCVPLPETLAADHAALAETLAVGIRALHRGRITPEDRVAIFGAGAIGLLAGQAARARGAAEVVIVDTLAPRRTIASEMGFDRVLHPDDVGEELEIDLALECSGRSAAIHGALRATRAGGRVVLVGLHSETVAIDPLAFVTQEKELIGSLSHVYDEDFTEAVRLLADGSIDPSRIITARRPLVDALSAFDSLDAHPTEHLKVLISPVRSTS
ncbi:alcohol dehydrogenase catalytic domain-containing protein [Streptomyces sioyaensis]|uniref:alcohol dehydrogenase catalytic domain-containing protein n=1 Tax=Streptomyces sioyaensis TaxID=67364 RepID=UPI003D720F39